jgi:hypothetical protein
MEKNVAPTEPAPAMTSDSGILLTLLKERVPNWYKQSADVLRAKLNEIAEAVYGDASAVAGLMSTVERMKSKEARDAEIAARLELYLVGLRQAKSAVTHFIIAERERTMLEARHTEDLARIERNRSGGVSAVYRFIQAFPEADLLPGWPRLEPKYLPENLEATSAAALVGTPEAQKLKRHQDELAAAIKLRIDMTAWGKAGHWSADKPRNRA